MTELHQTRSCISCSKVLRGRSDKKFCDDYCRNVYNNHLKSNGSNSPVVRQINNALLKNRKVLASILSDSEETARANREKLLQLGFQFRYFTHIYNTKSGKSYFYCYDYGYLPLDNEWYLIVRRKES